MALIDTLRGLPGTCLVLAARHYQLESPSFYTKWAVEAMERGLDSPNLARLANAEPDERRDELSRLIRRTCGELGIDEIDQEQAASVAILEVMRIIADGAVDWWSRIQDILLIEPLPASLKSLREDVELANGKVLCAGEERAGLASIHEAETKVKRAAERFVLESSEQLLEPIEGRIVLDVHIPRTFKIV